VSFRAVTANQSRPASVILDTYAVIDAMTHTMGRVLVDGADGQNLPTARGYSPGSAAHPDARSASHSAAESAPGVDVDTVRTVGDRIAHNIDQVIDGKHDTVRLGVAVLLAEGHLLIEDVPGVGKTKFAKALARSIDCSVRRVQFTPDLLPSDVTGVSVYNSEERDFEFKPGPVFANIVVGDEINRASPKTQSALLECMEERQVTVDGVTYPLEAPFLVLATQNPIDMEGTYPLPEAQRDRFTARISMGYPDRRAEIQMLGEHASLDPLDSLRPVSDAAEVRSLIAGVRAVHVADSIKAYAVDLAAATRGSAEVRLGASPRATLQLLRAAKAWAALGGREYVLPDDLQFMLVPVFAHRMLLTADAHVSGRTAAEVITDVGRRVTIPNTVGSGRRACPCGSAAVRPRRASVARADREPAQGRAAPRGRRRECRDAPDDLEPLAAADRLAHARGPTARPDARQRPLRARRTVQQGEPHRRLPDAAPAPRPLPRRPTTHPPDRSVPSRRRAPLVHRDQRDHRRARGRAASRCRTAAVAGRGRQRRQPLDRRPRRG
jgi:MoxR-like ATPase